MLFDAILGFFGQKDANKQVQKGIDATQRATDQQIGFLRETRDQTRADQEPWRQSGVGGVNALNALAGLGPSTQAVDYGAYASLNPQMEAHFAQYGGQFGGDKAAFGKWWHDNLDAQDGYDAPMRTVSSSENMLAELQQSPGYQFRLDEGARTRRAGAAAGGLYNSGAFAKGMERYAQDYASNEYGNRFNQLAGIAGLGQVANGANQNAGQNFAGQAGNALANNAARLSSSYQQQGSPWLAGAGAAKASFDNSANMFLKMYGMG